jgi:hypothetical protein
MFELGMGLSKKIAKRQAATNLLNTLENLEPEDKKALLNRAEGQVTDGHEFERYYSICLFKIVCV